MTRRNARVRFAFCCSKCGTWVPGGARCYTDDGTWWFCQQCALEHIPGRQESKAMSNTRKLRKAHPADRRNEWLGVIYVGGDVVRALAPADDGDPAAVQASVNLLLRPVFDSHYESPWPNAGPVPYTSVYATTLDGAPLNIEMTTWPGDRTTVRLTAESPAQRRVRLASSMLVT